MDHTTSLVLKTLTLLLICALIINTISNALSLVITRAIEVGRKNRLLRHHETLVDCHRSETVALLCAFGLVDVMRIQYSDVRSDYHITSTHVLLGKKTEDDLLSVSKGVMRQISKESYFNNQPLPTLVTVFVAGHGYIHPREVKPHPKTPRGQYRKPLK